MKKIYLLAYLLFKIMPVWAIEGLWLPFLLRNINESEMKSMGMKMSAEDIYSISKGSLKDAVVQFNGGCTGEIISDKGLLLTNHHCGFGQIQNHSTLEHNYLENGFWAKTMDQELTNPGLFVTFIISMEDVTDKIITPDVKTKILQERQSAIDKNLATLRKNYSKEKWQELVIRPFYDGNQYILFVVENYKDIRLVGTPPSAIGKFGADTDNWVWPRHTGDFSLFRIYANKENRPAEYASDNIPYKPKKYLSISLDGVSEGDFTLIYGFPGRTEEYVPAKRLEMMTNSINPMRVGMRDIALDRMVFHMKQSPSIKINYADKYSGISNSWKKWQGEMLGIKKSNAIAKKLNYENHLQSLLNRENSNHLEYLGLIPTYDSLLSAFSPYYYAREINQEMWYRNLDLFGSAQQYLKLLTIDPKRDSTQFLDHLKQIKSNIPSFYESFNLQVEHDIFCGLMDYYTKNIGKIGLPPTLKLLLGNGAKAEDIWSLVQARSVLISEQKLMQLMELKPFEIQKILKQDPLIFFSSELEQFLKENINSTVSNIQPSLNEIQRKYMEMQTKIDLKKRFYPDANGTLRCAYGQVQGYEPKDGVQYHYSTTAEGILEKYKPADYEFEVPQKLIQLIKNKDYGQYAENGKMPLAFIASNHTTGGNSGSPALDASGNLIGLNFDRVWEGTMSDLNFDSNICRNIMVDARYILFIIDKYAEAGHLIKEMNLIHPKKQAK